MIYRLLRLLAGLLLIVSSVLIVFGLIYVVMFMLMHNVSF